MNRGRLPIVIVLVLSLLGAGLTRQWAAHDKGTGVGAPAQTSPSAALSNMNSYALALLLGGLRGPLVMFLWPSSEQQKNEQNLEDFDTKIEWIRLLQAEFDSVHIFQIWNKAYNISVQMANIGNKYRTILDALDYAYSVDAERPNNINIISEIGRLFLSKLGDSYEKNYYRQRIREESKAREQMVRITFPLQKRGELTALALSAGVGQSGLHFSPDQNEQRIGITLPKSIGDQIRPRFSGEGISFTDRPLISFNRNDPRWRRTELDPMLDANGMILPEYLAPTMPRPADRDPALPWNDGSTLQYLARYQPFPYGISTLGLGYNYYKRAQVLQEVLKKKHMQTPEVGIDSQPVIAIKFWSEDEWERARRAELEAFNLPVSTERWEMDLATGDISPQAPIVYRKRLDEALYGYHMAARLSEDALSEYDRHLKNYKTKVDAYLSHIEELHAAKAALHGDEEFLQSLIDPASRDAKRAAAVEHYRDARRRYSLFLLEHFVSDELAQRFFPADVTRTTIAQKNLPDQDLIDILDRVRQAIPARRSLYEFWDEFQEFDADLQHVQARLKQLGQ